MAYQLIKPEEIKSHTIRGVLFDMDGLVLDTETLYARFWAEAARAMGYPMTHEQALGMRSLNRSAGQAQLEGYFGEGVDYHAIRAKRIELMSAHIDRYGVDPKPGIYELLDYLDSRGIPAAITSSSPQDRIQKYLMPWNLHHRFQKLCSGYEVPQGKPAPDIYLYGATQLGLRPEECMALEDSPSGILSAHRAGCVTVMIPDQDQPNAETLALLHAKADSLADIIDLLK